MAKAGIPQLLLSESPGGSVKKTLQDTNAMRPRQLMQGRWRSFRQTNFEVRPHCQPKLMTPSAHARSVLPDDSMPFPSMLWRIEDCVKEKWTKQRKLGTLREAKIRAQQTHPASLGKCRIIEISSARGGLVAGLTAPSQIPRESLPNLSLRLVVLRILLRQLLRFRTFHC